MSLFLVELHKNLDDVDVDCSRGGWKHLYNGSKNETPLRISLDLKEKGDDFTRALIEANCQVSLLDLNYAMGKGSVLQVCMVVGALIAKKKWDFELLFEDSDSDLLCLFQDKDEHNVLNKLVAIIPEDYVGISRRFVTQNCECLTHLACQVCSLIALHFSFELFFFLFRFSFRSKIFCC